MTFDSGQNSGESYSSAIPVLNFDIMNAYDAYGNYILNINSGEHLIRVRRDTHEITSYMDGDDCILSMTSSMTKNTLLFRFAKINAPDNVLPRDEVVALISNIYRL